MMIAVKFVFLNNPIHLDRRWQAHSTVKSAIIFVVPRDDQQVLA